MVLQHLQQDELAHLPGQRRVDQAAQGQVRQRRVGQEPVDPGAQRQHDLQVGQGAQQAGRHAPDQGDLDLGRIAGRGPGAVVEVGQPAQEGTAPGLGILVRAVEEKRHAAGPRARTCRGLVARLSHRCKAPHTTG
jgi:hypothetical protein